MFIRAEKMFKALSSVQIAKGISVEREDKGSGPVLS